MHPSGDGAVGPDASFFDRLVDRIPSRQIWLVVLGLALLFGIVQRLGSRIESKDSLGPTTFWNMGFLAFEMACATGIFLVVLLPLIRFLVEAPAITHRTVGSSGSIFFIGFWAKTWGLLSLAWLPYWIFLWPGVMTPDSYWQVKQALGILPYSEHHPLAHTLVIDGLLAMVMPLTGSINISLGFVSLLQLIVLGALTALALAGTVATVGTRWLRMGLIVFYAAHPLIGWYSVTLWKDMWLATFLLVLVVSLTRLVAAKSRAAHLMWWVSCGVSILGVLLSKKTGVFIVVPLLLISFLAMRRSRILLVTFSAVMLITSFVISQVLVVLTGATPGSSVEAFSLPSQQIARTVRDASGSLTNNQSTAIEHFYPGVELGEIYEPDLADPTKGALDEKALQDDLPGYVKLWFSTMLTAPRAHVEASLAGTSGYWNPETRYWLVQGGDWTFLVNGAKYNQERPPVVVDRQVVGLREGIAPHKVDAVIGVNEHLRSVPVLRWFLSLGAWTWLTLILVAVAALRRSRTAAPAAAASLLVLGTCLISPVFAEARYAYPMLLLLPVLAVATLQSATPTHQGPTDPPVQAERRRKM